MSPSRIMLRLNEQIPFECEFVTQYESIPRARRQEWLRSILRAGIAAAGSGVSYEPAAALIQPKEPVTTLDVPVIRAASQPKQESKTTNQKSTKPQELKGFFGDTSNPGIKQ